KAACRETATGPRPSSPAHSLNATLTPAQTTPGAIESTSPGPGIADWTFFHTTQRGNPSVRVCSSEVHRGARTDSGSPSDIVTPKLSVARARNTPPGPTETRSP